MCLSLSKLAGIRKKTEKGKTTQMEDWGEKSLACVITNNIIVHFGNIDIVLVRLGRHTLILNGLGSFIL